MRFNLTQQLSFILAVCILLTAGAAITPAYVLIRNELQEQLAQRRADAHRNTQIILDLERSKLENTVRLASERPTLRSLLDSADPERLTDYLREFQQHTDLDFLYVTDVSGSYLAGSPLDTTEPVMLHTLPIDNHLGTITGAIRFDEDFADRLSQQTGALYRFTSNPQRSNLAEIQQEGRTYAIEVFSLAAYTGLPDTTAEILVPVTGILALQTEIIGLLAVTTSIVTIIAVLLGGFYIRSRIHPLWQLTADAQRLGQGDLTDPIATKSQTTEIATLANVLEQSRANLARIMNELAQAKDFSEALIRSITEGIVTIDRSGLVAFLSEGANRILDLDTSELAAVGQPIDTLITISTDPAARFTDFVPPEGARRTVSVKTRQGMVKTLALTRAQTVNSEQTTIVLHDITEETQRRSLQAYFLANVSHEFRTPLSGMRVSIELLLENSRFLSAAETNELLLSLFISVTTLQNMIDNLLESSRIEANHLTLRRQKTELIPLLVNAIRMVQPFMNRRRQLLQLDEPFVLPGVNADPIRLVQVMVNLLFNASKFSPLGSVIEVIIDQRPNELYVAVADRGRGIDEAQREYVFQRFARLPESTSAEPGAGLGLAVVKAIIEAHGGRVGVDSREGGGAIFWFTLPCSEVA